MATVQHLTELLNEWDCSQSDIDMMLEFIKENGPNIYSISTEYNDYSISLLAEHEPDTLEAIRADALSEENMEYYEYDIYEDFENSEEEMKRGFLYGEGYFFVRID